MSLCHSPLGVIPNSYASEMEHLHLPTITSNSKVHLACVDADPNQKTLLAPK